MRVKLHTASAFYAVSRIISASDELHICNEYSMHRKRIHHIPTKFTRIVHDDCSFFPFASGKASLVNAYDIRIGHSIESPLSVAVFEGLHCKSKDLGAVSRMTVYIIVAESP